MTNFAEFWMFSKEYFLNVVFPRFVEMVLRFFGVFCGFCCRRSGGGVWSCGYACFEDFWVVEGVQPGDRFCFHGFLGKKMDRLGPSFFVVCLTIGFACLIDCWPPLFLFWDRVLFLFCFLEK